MDVFRRMGQYVQSRWRQVHLDEAEFPAIALDALREFPPAELASFDDLVDGWLFDGALPPGVSSGEFGEPAITVYAADRFYIEVLCWMDGTTQIHQHGFSGAFHVMRGSSLHSTYRFEARSRIDSQMRIGDVLFQECELLSRGASRAILPGQDFIHALFHLERPSISVVVRTRTERDHLPQWTYEPPHLALDPLHREVARRRQLRQALAAVAAVDPARRDRLVDRVVAEGDPSLVYAAILDCLTRAEEAPGEVDPRRVAAIGDAVVERLGAVGSALLATCRQELRTAALRQLRAEVHDPELRFFLALLLNMPTRAAIFDVVARAFRADPASLVRGWLRRLTRTDGAGLELLEMQVELERPGEELALGDLLHQVIAALLAGARGAELVGAVEAESPLRGGGAMRGVIGSLETMLLESSLRPLFASPAGMLAASAEGAALP